MFNENFYPSPSEVIRLLTENINVNYQTKILEPSAGKGDIADYLVNHYNKKEAIQVIEKEPELCSILSDKGYMVVGYDFLTFETHTEYDLIIMNPPFSEGTKHLIKAIRLAEAQSYNECTISCIINAETLKNPFSNERKELVTLLNKHHATITYHDNLFVNAERKTNVETAIVQLAVATTQQKVADNFSAIKNTIDELSERETFTTSLSTVLQSQELQERINDIDGLVKRYNYHVKLVKGLFESKRSLDYLGELLMNERSMDMLLPFDLVKGEQNDLIARLREKYWTAILRTDEFEAHLTEHGRQQIWKYMEHASNLEITIDNIKMLLTAIMQNSSSIIVDSCVNIFEKITRYHNAEYSKNIHYYNGWTTNNAFKVNKKIVYPMYFDRWDNIFAESFDKLAWDLKNFFNDFNKMLKLIKPDFDEQFQTISPQEFENDVYRFKVFKKGTVHIWFKDLALLDRFNYICGQHFNWVPADEEIKRNKKAQEYVYEHFNDYMKTVKIG
ncbi:DUF4942 domain-containing protein [Listeria monocytogenes]|nr:DUF4942 domain-containing protein [Listeria monocytogenes]EAC8063658.1 DUF4942 domain-containing protein [Listeria monocytogenes]EAC8067312.1 DUF4942 domain-containing protein [Listeria monocytogenes]